MSGFRRLRSLPRQDRQPTCNCSTDSSDVKAGSSSYGDWVDISAPGVDVLSLRAAYTDMYGGGGHIVDTYYYIASGTSIALTLSAF